MANKRKRYNKNLNISGNTIRKIREKRKLSREVLSSKLLLEEEIDISAQAITKIENNLRTVCDYELNGLSKVLNVEISVLVN